MAADSSAYCLPISIAFRAFFDGSSCSIVRIERLLTRIESSSNVSRAERSRKQTGIAFARLVAERLGKHRHIFYRYHLTIWDGGVGTRRACFCQTQPKFLLRCVVYGRKWELSCEHLIKDDTRRIDVTGGCFVVMKSFRRHVQERASGTDHAELVGRYSSQGRNPQPYRTSRKRRRSKGCFAVSRLGELLPVSGNVPLRGLRKSASEYRTVISGRSRDWDERNE